MKVEKRVTIECKDIAIVERLHDMLLEKYKVPLGHELLKEARALFRKMYEAIEED
jgi:hypothetical protein